jgi:hypothetical protein
MKIRRKVLPWIVMVLSSVLILIGVAIMAYFLCVSDSEGSFELNLTANGKKKVEFDELFLIPGEQREYTISLRSDLDGQYTLAFDPVEEGDKTLKYYARVKMEIDGEVICDKLLTDFFDDDPILLQCYLTNDEAYDVKFTYYMPIEIGNEAENASADFDIIITAK